MARRNVPRSPSLNRRSAHAEPRRKVVIVCEGKNTEPEYFKAFVRDHASQLVELVVEAAAGVPMTIVQRAVQLKKEQQYVGRRQGNSFEKYFEVWGVFDCDEHPNLAEAMELARSNGIEVALSNPCFELWAFMHFEMQDAPIHRIEMQRKLAAVLDGYTPGHGKRLNYETLRARYDDAKRNAQRSLERRRQEADPRGNPSTNVFALLEKILENGKKRDG